MKIKTQHIFAVSFDLWGTLIKSNPEYRAKRNEYLCKYTDMQPEIVEAVIKRIKRDVDDNVEKFGLHFESLDVYNMIHKQCKITGIKPEDLYHDCSALFIQYPPILIEGVDQVLTRLKVEGYDIYLSSNTVLIDGKFLTVALMKLGIHRYFTKLFFSNELRLSKPSPKFFQAVQMHSGLRADQIIHVGDNAITDAKGSTDYGFRTFLLSGGLTVNEFYTSFENYKDMPAMFDIEHQQE